MEILLLSWRHFTVISLLYWRNNFPAEVNLHKHDTSLFSCLFWRFATWHYVHVHRKKRSELVQILVIDYLGQSYNIVFTFLQRSVEREKEMCSNFVSCKDGATLLLTEFQCSCKCTCAVFVSPRHSPTYRPRFRLKLETIRDFFFLFRGFLYVSFTAVFCCCFRNRSR